MSYKNIIIMENLIINKMHCTAVEERRGGADVAGVSRVLRVRRSRSALGPAGNRKWTNRALPLPFAPLCVRRSAGRALFHSPSTDLVFCAVEVI